MNQQLPEGTVTVLFIAVLALPLLALWSPLLRRERQPTPAPEATAPAQAD